MSSSSPPPKSERLATALIFILAAAFLRWLAASRFFLTLDEGIYLEGAARILRGQAPYRDFFSLTGPGSFWLQALVLGLFGKTLAHARLVLVADIAALTASVYWLTARLARRALALGTAFVFFSFETALGFRLYINHRWDSAAFGLAATALLISDAPSPRPARSFVAGLAAATAAWFTPPLAALTLVLGLWLFWKSERRASCWLYSSGVVLASLAAASVLLAQGALLPMLRDLLWAARNYPAANRVPYGYGAIPPGGLSQVFAGARGSDFPLRALGLTAVLLPPALPIAVYLLAIISRLRRQDAARSPNENLLLFASLALVASSYPRWSADQLLFIAPIFYVLLAFYLNRWLRSEPWRAAAFAFALGVSSVALLNSAFMTASLPVIETRIGPLRAAAPDSAFIQFAEESVPPGTTLFVYPYLPLAYFLTGTVNPTRFDFLQPGMMTAADESAALTELRARPPDRVFSVNLPAAAYRRIWPRSHINPAAPDPIRDFIRTHYHLLGAFHHPVGDFQVLARDKN